MLLSFFSFIFLSAVQIGSFPLFCIPDHLFIILCHLVSYSLLLDWFLCQQLNHLFLIGSSLQFLVLVTVICVSINNLS